MSQESAAKIAGVAAEAIHSLNYATMPNSGSLQYPGDVYDTVAGLSRLAMHFPQALQQLGRFVQGLETEGKLRSVEADQPLPEVLLALYEALGAAGASATALYQALNAAHNALSPIAYQDTEA